MFTKKNKQATKGREAPSLPDRSHGQHTLPPIPTTNKSCYLTEQVEPQLPARSTSPYPGTWKPARREVPPIPPVSKPPDRGSTSSFDDEYVAPGDIDINDTSSQFNQMSSQSSQFNQMSHYPTQDPHWGHQKPTTPPLPDFGDEDQYAAPDEFNNGHTTNSNGYPFHQYQQNQAPSTPPLEDDLYIAPGDANPTEDTYDAPEEIQMLPSYQSARNNAYPYQRGPETPPPVPIDDQEIYDAPDDDLHHPNTGQQYTEESYDIPENIDNGFGYGQGHFRGPSTPPLPVTPPLSVSPFDEQDVYDTPDHDAFIPPPFAPPVQPKAAPSKPTIPVPISPDKDSLKKSSQINELTKRLETMNRIQDAPIQPTTNQFRNNLANENPSTTPKSPVKRPLIKQTIPPTKAKPITMNKLEDQVWFKQGFKRNTSEDFLRTYNIDGGFIIRPSTKDGPGNYSFSIYFQGEIRHLRIRKKDNGKYSIGEEKENELEFDSVLKCVEYHKDEPLILKAGGEVCLYVLQ